MTLLLLGVNGLIMLIAPLVVGTYLARRYRAEWGLFGAGAVTFIASQILHIPFNNFVAARFLPELAPGFSTQLVLVAIFYGLSAGLFEEVARYVTFRFWRKDARSWKDGLMVGAGHGGVESLIVGILFMVNTAFVIGVDRGLFRALLPAEALPLLEEQLAALYALRWYEMLLGGVERILAITLHLGLSLIVLRAVQRRQPLWLLVAILWHATFNAVALVMSMLTSLVIVELILGVFALATLVLIWRWREDETGMQDETAEAPPLRPAVLTDLGRLDDKIDESRYVE